jgi:predicted RNA-binding Zn-ribbon protein involved in translation (DUF1610 family)
MAVKAKCPKCGKVISMQREQVANRQRCPSCSHRFVPASDSGFLCPKCGRDIVITPGELRKDISCLSCGYVLTRKGRTRLSAWIALAAVAVIFVIIFFFGFPDLVNYKWEDNESSAISSLRTFSSTQDQYRKRHGRYATLEELCNASLISGSLGVARSRERATNGYYYIMAAGENVWRCYALPAKRGETGKRSFYIDESSIMRYSPCESDGDSPADVNSKVVGGD